MASSLPAPLRTTPLRRAVTVPAVFAAASTLAGSIGLWAPVAAAVDLRDDPARMPRLRAGAFALGWSALESIGVGLSAALWASGRSDDEDLHYALQRWWASRLVDTLRHTLNLRIEVDGIDELTPGPIVMLARHASIPDSLLPAWLLGRVGMRPRYVLKDDLQLDPCLDIVGNRLPNHFVDRTPDDSATELALLEALAAEMDDRDACVIFPEGGVVTDDGRERSKEKIRTRDPSRFPRVESLRVLGPVRPGGSAALLRGAPDADLVIVTFTGLDSLQRLASAPRQIPLEEPVRVSIVRYPRAEVPGGDGFLPWLDRRWAECDLHISAQPGAARLRAL